ncbi:MAG: uridine monophosphate kinase [Clostridiales bacterium]|nr:uridine monophosphate kinase [Clostridiales bacterium]
MIRRTVIKLSGEALAGEVPVPAEFFNPFSDAVIHSIVSQIKTVLNDARVQVALVLGGGNFWRGRQAPEGMDRSRADQIGMLATVMNGIYLMEAFRKQGVRARVATPIPIGQFTEIYERDAALAYMESGGVLINAAGLGHPYFSTDTITALRAAELSADCILYAKSVDGVFDKDPKKFKDARKFKTLSYRKAIAETLNAADMAALHLSNDAKIPSFVFGLDEPLSLVSACNFPETAPLEGTFLDVNAEDIFY